ncbi:MAG: ACP phosphodiesterase [Salinivirgaceae bacterium]
MNYLAHIFLSGNDEQVIVGNFIADAVKGRNFTHYPQGIQDGITLHRKIDHFTDTHTIISETNLLFAPYYGKYAGVVTDIVFDHLLVKNWSTFHSEPLPIFLDRMNIILLKWFHQMPLRMQLYMPFWIKNRWPELYGSFEGVCRVLKGMARYTSLPENAENAVKVIAINKEVLSMLFLDFFEQIQQAVIVEKQI